MAAAKEVEATPAPEIATETVTTIGEYAALVATRTAGDDPLWFRGMSNPSHELAPSLFRNYAADQSDVALLREKEMIGAFRFRAPPFMAHDLPHAPATADLETLFIMQHHGIPTRLLDWTENPFVALFFALQKARSRVTPTTDCVIWLLDPILLNKISLSTTAKDVDRVFTVDHPNLHGYRPGSVGQKMPVGIYGVHNSRRIVAQRGVFVIFGTEIVPLNGQEKIVAAGALTKVLIPRANMVAMYASLFKMGFTDSVVFPDLDGLAAEIAFQYGF